MALKRWKAKQAAERETAADAPAPVEPIAYNSQAFELWQREARFEGKRHILDLGTADGDNVRFFGEEPCTLQLVGLTDALPIRGDRVRAEDPDEREAIALRQHLPELAPGSQQGVLCWDLLNYLSRPQIVALADWLAEVMAPGGVVLLTLHAGSSMPPAPSRYSIQGPGSLLRRDAEGEPIACGRYSQSELKKDWTEFDIIRSFLLRSQSQEYVLRRS